MRACFTTLFFLPILALGQAAEFIAKPSTRIDYYVNLYYQTDGSSAPTDQVLRFVEKLERKKPSFRQDTDFLEYLFNKTHHRFLKYFEDYSSFGEMLDRGTYNCLTGTALYALLLDHFDIRYQVIETNYHVFLLAYTDQGTVLLETTDPTSGFVTDYDEIQQRITQYKQNSIRKVKPTKTYYRYNFEIYNEVNLDQMLGLLYYNLSIISFNQQKLPLSIHHLSKAMELYQSPRIEEFARIILLSVMESKLEASVKEKCVKSIQSMRKKQFAVTASAN